jgi:hypothetical protein
MNHIPMHPEFMSDQQRIESLVHMNQAFLALVAIDAELLTRLDPAGLPNDLAAHVRKYAEAQRELVNASRAELERILWPAPNRVSDPLQ